VSATPDGAVPLSSSVAARSFVVCAEASVASTVVGLGGGASPNGGLIVTTPSPVAAAESRTRNLNESDAPADAGV
jgi:hypothetical protein